MLTIEPKIQEIPRENIMERKLERLTGSVLPQLTLSKNALPPEQYRELKPENTCSGLVVRIYLSSIWFLNLRRYDNCCT